MALEKGEKPAQKKQWYQIIREEIGKYGWVALILAIIGFLYYYHRDLYHLVLERADQQAEINLRIGKIEGQLEMILENKNTGCER